MLEVGRKGDNVTVAVLLVDSSMGVRCTAFVADSRFVELNCGDAQCATLNSIRWIPLERG